MKIILIFIIMVSFYSSFNWNYFIGKIAYNYIKIILNCGIVSSVIKSKTISIYCSTSFILNNSNYTICKWIDTSDQTNHYDTYDNAKNDCPSGYELASSSEFENKDFFNSINFSIENCQRYAFFL
jgi:type II secretory pathway component PulF